LTEPILPEQTLWAAVIAALGGVTGAIIKILRSNKDILMLRQRTHEYGNILHQTIGRISVLESQYDETQRRLAGIDGKLDRILERLEGRR
jgi:hypothetical protein